MSYDIEYAAEKIRSWKTYLNNYKLPEWEMIPDFGLYMEQVIDLMKQYLDYYPPELKEEQFITASTINNYVRTKIMPRPVKKKYYRKHLAFLIIILSLKQSISIALIQKIIPVNVSDEELKAIYCKHISNHLKASQYFIKEMEQIASPLLNLDNTSEYSVSNVDDLISMNVIAGGLSRLFAEKLLLLDNKITEKNEPTVNK